MSAGDTIRMTSGAPWSVKGIDPKAREIAKDLARRSGMTLGEWLNRMIVEGDPVSPSEIAEEFGIEPGPAFEPPLEPVIIRSPRRGAAPRYEVAGHPADEVGRVAEAIERLTARIEAAILGESNPPLSHNATVGRRRRSRTALSSVARNCSI